MLFGHGRLTRQILTEAAIKCKLRTQNKLVDLPSAAIIIPLVNIREEAALLFEVRSKTLRQHGGEISFPGGFLEVGETTWECAKRETWEELAWEIDDSNLIGELGEWHNRKSNVRAIHFVILNEKIDLRDLKANPSEVEYFFTTRLTDLLSVERREYRRLYHEWPPVPFFYADDNHMIWGFTGFVLDAFLRELCKLL